MNERNTKQREIILQTITCSNDHPTMNEIMEKVKEKDEGIGQATIYRNVNKLVVSGKVRKLPISLDNVRYDDNSTPHDHLVCVRCGQIIDLYDNNYVNDKERLEKEYSFKISGVSTIYEGVCANCQSNIEKR